MPFRLTGSIPSGGGGGGGASVGSATPLIEGTGAAGSSANASREDHVHPTLIDDTATTASTSRAWSPSRINTFVTAAINGLVNGAGSALDTLKELQDALGGDANFATTVATALANRLRTDTAAQGLTGTQQGNARTNLGVYSQAEIDAIVAALTGNMIADGESVMERDLQALTTIGNSSQQLRAAFLTATKSQTVNSVRLQTGTIAAAGLTLCRIGVWSVDGAGAGTLVASTPNDTALLAATTTEYTKALSAPFNKVRGQRYAVGLLQVGTTPANLTGLQGSGTNAARAGRSPRRAGLWPGQADLPASFTDANFTNTATVANFDMIV